MDKYKKGEDITLDAVWLDATGVALKPSDLAKYMVKVFSVDDNSEAVLVFSSLPIDDQKPIEVVSDVDGKVRLKFQRDWTSDASATSYVADIYWYFNVPGAIEDMELEIIEGVELFKLID